MNDYSEVKILLVEDDIASSFLLERIISKFTSKVLTANNGKKGLDLFLQEKPDLVITDIGMPVMDGLELSKEIKKISPKTHIVILSAFDNKEPLLEAINIGIDQYLLKPVDSEIIKKAITKGLQILYLEQELKQKNEQVEILSKAVEYSSSMVMILNPNDEIEYVNKQFLDFSGYSLDELLKKNLIICFEDDNFRNEYHDFLKNKEKGQNWTGEFVERKKNGEKYWVSATISPIYNDQGTISHFVQIMEDITKKKLYQQELQETNVILEEKVIDRTKQLIIEKENAENANKAKSLFLAKVSHELRTPMNGILGMTSVLLDTPLTERQRRNLHIVKSSADSLLTIINDILDYSQIESGIFKIHISEFNLKNLIDKIINLLKKLYEEKGLEFNLEYDSTIPELLKSDPNRIKQVLINLLGNAIKFTEKGSVSLIVEKIMEDENTIFIKFSIKDTGIGIQKDKISQLFQSFSQIDGELNRKYGGTGLGLAISKEIIERLNGDIWLESTYKKGSNFYFSLTFYKNQEDIINAYDQSVKVVEPAIDLKEQLNEFLNLNNYILIAEDSEINQELLKEVLSYTSIIFDFANDGVQAVELANKNNYDLIFMDIQMPKKDGLEATYEIISQKPDQIIIGLTAHSHKSNKLKCLEYGMKDVVTKPIDWDKFFRKIITYTNSNQEIPLNLTTMLDSINYKETILIKIIDNYKTNHSSIIKNLNSAIDNNDYNTIQTITHRLKSEISTFRANDALEIITKVHDLSFKNPENITKEDIEKIILELDKINLYFNKNNISQIIKYFKDNKYENFSN